MEINLQLPVLPYDQKDLVPFITEETLSYHYGKHHAAYVNNLAGLVKDTPWADARVETIVRESYAQGHLPVFNNAAQHWNHSFFWHCLSPAGGGEPDGNLRVLIERDFGNFSQFKSLFATAALKLFGAGWAWLAQDADGKLEILPLKDAHTPLTAGKRPLLTIDVWEHAYYIDYRNARNKFIDGFWEVVNWDFANSMVQH